MPRMFRFTFRGLRAIGRKEYTKLCRIFVQIQGARQAHSDLCNCRATHKLNDDKDKQVGIFFDRNRLSWLPSWRMRARDTFIRGREFQTIR